MQSTNYWMSISRRAFLRNGTLLLGAATVVQPKSLLGEESQPRLHIGLITDLHYADKPPAGTRHYRETLGKLTEAATEFDKRELSFVVELGDLIDAADSADTEQ